MVHPLSPEEAALAQKSLAQVAYSPDCDDAKACAPAEADLVQWAPVSKLDEAMVREMMDQTEEVPPDGDRDGGVLESGGTVVVKRYVFNGQVIATRRGETLYFLRPDHLDAAGNKVAESRHLPYGQERWASGTLPTDYRFTGQRDTGLGLYHMGARFYDAYLARWLSADTIVPDPANPQNLNRYSYVSGHPLNATDPSGHMELNEGDEYQKAYAEETYYCYINPTVPGCQTSWNDVRDAGLLFLTWASAPNLIKGGIQVVVRIG
ncbi:MAG: RHS repeat-associated core domain-containing protein, partial [Anaerolineae bacterium]